MRFCSNVTQPHIIRELPSSPEVMLFLLRVGGLLGGDIYGFGRVLFLPFILGFELGIVGFLAFVHLLCDGLDALGDETRATLYV